LKTGQSQTNTRSVFGQTAPVSSSAGFAPFFQVRRDRDLRFCCNKAYVRDDDFVSPMQQKPVRTVSCTVLSKYFFFTFLVFHLGFILQCFALVLKQWLKAANERLHA